MSIAEESARNFGKVFELFYIAIATSLIGVLIGFVRTVSPELRLCLAMWVWLFVVSLILPERYGIIKELCQVSAILGVGICLIYGICQFLLVEPFICLASLILINASHELHSWVCSRFNRRWPNFDLHEEDYLYIEEGKNGAVIVMLVIVLSVIIAASSVAKYYLVGLGLACGVTLLCFCLWAMQIRFCAVRSKR